MINFYGITAIIACCFISMARADSIPHDQQKDKYTVPLTATLIPLNHKNASLTKVGKLRYMGGLKITSTKKRFGGISSFVISPDGHQVLGISDRGHWLVADMVYNHNNHLINIKNARMAPLKKNYSQKNRTVSDAEALTAVDGAGYVVSFESPHALRYFQADRPDDFGSLFTARAQKITFASDLPENYVSLPNNLGIEALTTMPDGRMLAFSESTVNREGSTQAQGWLIGHGKVEALSYEISPSYRPTDMATLPNGDILVLERHFSLARGMAARLSRLPAMSIKAGETIKGEVIADLAYPFNLDNMEALAVR
ncbi:MAG: esterase-like activity of phytase family protein, partial [Emcibacter sp.]|nr:esterase-like activity of phytase family protein [Emcibacter sp.]